MGLKSEVKRITLIDHFLVEIDASVTERTTESGIVVVEDNERISNFGVVLKVPDYYRENTNYRTLRRAAGKSSSSLNKKSAVYSSEGEAVWVSSVSEGDIVFFRRNATHEPIELASGEPGKEYILVHLDNVVGFYSSSKED